jgi:uncharacterized membrane protein
MNVFAEESLSISKWIVASELMENGDLQITEDLTFVFKDEFNGVFRDIVLEGTDGISNIELFEIVDGMEVPYTLNQNAKKGDRNVFSSEEDNNSINLMIFSPSEDEEKTFRIKYTLLNVAVMHSDTGELYYKYLGDENKTPIDYFSVNLILPEFNREDIKIFGHGPLNGTINFTDTDLIRLKVDDVPTRTYIEARILYPKDYTPLSNNTGNKDLNELLDEEASYAKGIEERERRKETNKGIFNKISIALIALGAVVSAFLLKLTKRNPDIYNSMDSLNPKDISPAELNIFINQYADSRGLLATIFDLARREYISIDEIEISNEKKKKSRKKEEFLFTRKNLLDNSLLDHESYLLDWLFNTIGDGNSLSTIDIEKYRTKKMMEFNKKQTEWIKLVKEQLDSRDYYDKKHKSTGLLSLILSIAIFIVGIISIVFGGLYGIGAILVSIILFIYGIWLMNRKSDEGYIQYGLWRDFKKEFDNYGDLDIGIPKDLTLIYAVALGLNMKKLEQQRISYGNDYYPMYWGYWYFMHINKKGGSAFEDRFNNSFYGSTGTSNPNSTSFGGGGGFTGGGGGGAGGGGAGGF